MRMTAVCIHIRLRHPPSKRVFDTFIAEQYAYLYGRTFIKYFELRTLNLVQFNVSITQLCCLLQKFRQQSQYHHERSCNENTKSFSLIDFNLHNFHLSQKYSGLFSLEWSHKTPSTVLFLTKFFSNPNQPEATPRTLHFFHAYDLHMVEPLTNDVFHLSPA